jgi:hypothetical protein
MAKKARPPRDSFAASTISTAGSRAVAGAIASPAPAGLDLERTTLVLPTSLRADIERRILDLGRRVSFSGFMEAAAREALAGDTEAILSRWDARARRRTA